jgi:Ring finger domain
MSVTACRYHIDTKKITCNFCQKKLSEQPDQIVRVKCGHLFHRACFDQLLETPDRLLQRREGVCQLPLDNAQNIQRVKGCQYRVISESEVPCEVAKILKESDADIRRLTNGYLAFVMCWTSAFVGFVAGRFFK